MRLTPIIYNQTRTPLISRQMAATEERNNERRHQPQMAQYGLNEMKFNYQQQQNEAGGLKYQEAMARIAQNNAGAKEHQAQADDGLPEPNPSQPALSRTPDPPSHQATRRPLPRRRRKS